MLEFNCARLSRDKSANLCVGNIFEMPDVGIRIVETANKRTSAGMDCQISLAGFWITASPSLDNVCNEKDGGDSSKHFKRFEDGKD